MDLLEGVDRPTIDSLASERMVASPEQIEPTRWSDYVNVHWPGRMKACTEALAAGLLNGGRL